jgi:hypothetical protein
MSTKSSAGDAGLEALANSYYYQVKMAAGEDGCSHCGGGKMWAIVYVEHGQTEETEIGQTFGDKNLADDICDLMNMAYEAGMECSDPLAAAARDLLEQADVPCMRGAEEISVAEGCPCATCVLRRLAGLS